MTRKKKPIPISVSVGESDISFTTMTPTSIILHDFRTLSRPMTTRVTQFPKPTLEEHSESLKLPPLSRHINGFSDFNELSLPLSPSKALLPSSTPTTSIHREFTAIELPGSILLPNGGFPEALHRPSTPTRTASNRSSDDTLIGSPPELTPSPSTSEEKMDLHLLRGFSAKRLKDEEYSGKPFDEMTTEQMFLALPRLSARAVSESWIPAMADKIERFKALLQTGATKDLEQTAEMNTALSDYFSVSTLSPHDG